MRAIKLCPDVNYDKTFGTVRLNVDQAFGAYSVLFIKFGGFVI